MSKLTKILSIDGGGIRGVIPAMVLAEIEDRTQKPISELFQLIAGTSTGGILTLALTKPDETGKPKYSARDLIGLYEKEGERIFHRSTSYKIFSLMGLGEEKYPSKGIESVLNEYFGETHLSKSLTEVLITSYDIEGRKPLFFSSEEKDGKAHDFLMKQVARATSAAPVYFEPAKIGNSKQYALIDGGVFANNPAMCAYVEAVEADKAEGIRPKDDSYLLVSLGTGQYNQKIPYNKAKGWGLKGWAKPILDVVFDGVSDTVDHQLKHMLSSDDEIYYYRFQTELSDNNDSMDDASAENIEVLKQLARDIIKDRDDDLSRLCERLVE